MQFAALEATQTLAETRFQSVQPLDQRTREVIQQFALAGEAEAAAAALEQRHAHVASQGLQLQSDSRLAEEQGFGGTRHRTQARKLANGTQRLAAIALVVKLLAALRHKSLLEFQIFVGLYLDRKSVV